jgi:hypothetical protein
MLSSGDKVGKLRLIERFYKQTGKRKRSYWTCVCECGNMVEVREDNLINHHTLSCGCYQKEMSSLTNSKDGNFFFDSSETRKQLRAIWRRMKRRCYDKNFESYSSYGGRGISVDERWLVFENFYIDMVDSYKPGLSLDRIDVNGNYSKENCKWSDRIEQANNRVSTRYVEYAGEILPMAEAHRKYAIPGLKFSTFASRVLRGWEVETALLTPVNKKNSQES